LILHLEVFSGDDVPGFIAQSQARAAQLPDSQKTLLTVATGAALCQPIEPDGTLAADAAVRALDGAAAGKGPWVQVQKLKTIFIDRSGLPFNEHDPPHGSYTYGRGKAYFTGRYIGPTDTDITSDRAVALRLNYQRREVQIADGSPIWMDRHDVHNPAGKSAWCQFPLQTDQTNTPTAAQPRTIAKAVLDKLAEGRKASDDQGTKWWNIDVGSENGHSARGWVCEQNHPQTRWQSPWDWPGFATLQETATPAQLMQRLLHTLDAAQDSGEASQFQTAARTVNNGPLLSTLNQLIDSQGTQDGMITAEELRRSYRQPWLAERIGKLIVRYPSEWASDMSPWNDLDVMMLEGHPDWTVEKQRIAKLQIWSGAGSVASFPTSPNVYHFHPVGVVGNFSGAPQLITIEMLRAVEPLNSEAYYERIIPHLNQYAILYEVQTPRRIAHFLSQVGHESSFHITEESLNYGAKRMREIFGCNGGSKHYNKSTDDCSLGRLRNKLWTDAAYYEHNAEHLGNYVYANKNKNGDESSGDGYKYRGRGIIQLTGRGNYSSFQDFHNSIAPQDTKDFLSNPELLVSEVKYGVESAFYYWKINNLNSVAETGDVKSVTQIVNGGQNGYDDRKERYNRLAPLLALSTEP